MAKKRCSDIGNIGNKSTDTDIVILGSIYWADIPISLSVHLYRLVTSFASATSLGTSGNNAVGLSTCNKLVENNLVASRGVAES